MHRALRRCSHRRRPIASVGHRGGVRPIDLSGAGLALTLGFSDCLALFVLFFNLRHYYCLSWRGRRV
ncbi:hypothetical protein EDB83DRAFT_2673973 [Lactarius deliciosus]|nr:hypothetical protein EDB83DRAFT_2673973 [Lactarius deliciosus]